MTCIGLDTSPDGHCPFDIENLAFARSSAGRRSQTQVRFNDSIQTSGYIYLFYNSATDLFAFQGSQPRAAPKSTLPDQVRDWPALSLDHLAASIGSSATEDVRHNISDQSTRDSNMNSLLAISDNTGHIYCFLDGSYPLGAIETKPKTSTPSLFKIPKQPFFLAHVIKEGGGPICSELLPTTLEVPLLRTRNPRDMANLSSTARALVWYALRIVKNMRAVWFGSEAYSAARELGPKWITALEEKQKKQFGRQYTKCEPLFTLTQAIKRRSLTGC